MLNPSVREPYAVTYRCLADNAPIKPVVQNFTRYCFSQPHGHLTSFQCTEIAAETNTTRFQEEISDQNSTDSCSKENTEFRYHSLVIASIEQRPFGKAYHFIRNSPKVITYNQFNESTARSVINVVYEERLPPTLSPTLSPSEFPSGLPTPFTNAPSLQPSLKVISSDVPTESDTDLKSAASNPVKEDSYFRFREFMILSFFIFVYFTI